MRANRTSWAGTSHNAREDVMMEKVSNGKDWKLDLTFDYTGRYIPKSNHLVEIGFHTLGGRARSILQKSNIPDKIC